MAFIVPAAAAFLGLGTVGTAVLQIGVAVGLGFVANRLAPKPKAASSQAQQGRRVGLQIATDIPRQAIFGTTAAAGSLVYWQLSGANNSRLHMVIALADHECDGLDGVWVNGKLKSIDGSGNVDGFGSKLRVTFYSGSSTQNADADLIATSNGRWTANERGRGVCYVVVRIDYDETLFPDIPQMEFVVRGAKLYDPRSETTAYTANPAVVLWNVLRGFQVGGVPLIGMNVPATAIRSDDFTAAANACDEAITLAASGTEPRYRCGIRFEATETNRDIVETLLASMAGELIETGGIYRMMAGVAQSTVAALTDADLIVDRPFIASPRRPRSQLVNAVFGSYSAPDRAYAMVPLPNRTSSVDEAEDGGIRLSKTLDLEAVNSRTQAQRIMEIERKRARRQLTVSGTFRARRCNLEPGDWITLTSTRRGYDARVLEVVGLRGAQDLTTEIDFIEVDDGLDDWSASDEIADNQSTDLQSAGPSLSAVSGVALTNVTVTSLSGAQRPGLRITWTAIDDATVVSLALEYRRVGDTVALERTILEPSAAQYTWLDGVVGDTEYEARLRPITQPERATEWSSWAATEALSDPQVVDLAAAVPPDTITPEMLDPQTRFELQLVTDLETVQGSVSDRLQRVLDEIVATNEALATVQWFTAENDAYISRVERTVVTETQALAETIDTVAAQFGPIQTQVTENALAIAGMDGWAARWSVSIEANGYVEGAITLDGNDEETTFGVLADKFVVAQPGLAGGDPLIPFTIGMVNGVSGIGITGNVIIDGSILARHISVLTLSAIAADIGTVTAGRIQNADNTTYLDLNTGDFQIG